MHRRSSTQGRVSAVDLLVCVVAAQDELEGEEPGDLISAWARVEGLLASVSDQVVGFPLEAVAGPASQSDRLSVHFCWALDPVEERLNRMKEGG
jgi:hypothetical protein